MATHDSNSAEKSVAAIAMEAFRLLGSRRISPTPEAYKSAFYEIAGTNLPQETSSSKTKEQLEEERKYNEALSVLQDFAEKLSRIHNDVASFGQSLLTAIHAKNFKQYEKILGSLTTRYLHPASEKVQSTPHEETKSKGISLVDDEPKSRNISLVDDAITPKSKGISLVDDEIETKSRQIKLVDDEIPPQNIQLVDHIDPLQEKTKKAPTPSSSTDLTQQLRELLTRTLAFGISALLYDDPELAQEAETLGNALKTTDALKDFEGLSKKIQQLCFKIEMKGATGAEQQELLLRLFKLLLNNIGELIEDDSWLKGQVDVLKELTDGPVTYRILEDTENNLKEVIYKQSQLKNSLSEAKESIKQMMLSFIDRLTFMTESTGNYHENIKGLSEKISKTNNAVELNEILSTIMSATNAVQTDMVSSLEQMQSDKKRVQEAENRVKDLETQIEQLGAKIREDTLTGSLNRRGLDDAFEREIARSDRLNTPLCVALLDIDNFKRLNDTYGHLAGDEALIHLVRIVKQTLRPTDVIARYGGEEFVILFPDTELQDGILTMKRVQRELTKHFFMHNDEHILITFSGGIALRKKDEPPEAVTKRADDAMYVAKKTGKNRVVSAD